MIRQPVLETSPADRLLTRDELSRMLKLSKRTISRMIATRKLPPPIRLGHSVRWREADISAWIDRGCPKVDPSRHSE
jgi:excisionase family DNA binding protein